MNNTSIFVDESGDLGFDFTKKRTRPYFVIGALVCKNANAYTAIKKAVEKTIKNKIYKNSNKKRQIIELKGSKTVLNIKKYFLNECRSSLDWSLYFNILHKEKIDIRFWSREGKICLYNLLAKDLIKQIQFDTWDSSVNLYIDKHKSRKEESIFNKYIEAHLTAKVSLNSKLNCYHLDSVSSKGIQAIDMFLWGLFEKYNYEQTEWYDLFKQHIVFEEIFENQDGDPLSLFTSRLISNRWKGASQE